MSIVHVRVESRRGGNVSNMLRAFKRACNEAGIMHDYKEHEFFTRKTDKRRRKAAMRKMTARLGYQEEEKPYRELN